MIETVVTPQNSNFDMSVSLPDDFVGKEVHVLFYIDEEVKKTTASVLPKKNRQTFLVHLAKRTAKRCRRMLLKAATNEAIYLIRSFIIRIKHTNTLSYFFNRVRY